jgi:sugar phosphate isomerase/epimerase
MGAPIVRVFSYWRTVKPEECFEAVVKSLRKLAEEAEKENLIIGLENEHACNIGTGRETARVLAALDHPNLKVVWDPANALVAGETPIPDGYRVLDPKRVAHVHAKDCKMIDHKPEWGPLGTRSVDWKGQIEALLKDDYHGWLSLETHWPGPGGNKLEGSTICGWNLRGLASGD